MNLIPLGLIEQKQTPSSRYKPIKPTSCYVCTAMRSITNATGAAVVFLRRGLFKCLCLLSTGKRLLACASTTWLPSQCQGTAPSRYSPKTVTWTVVRQVKYSSAMHAFWQVVLGFNIPTAVIFQELFTTFFSALDTFPCIHFECGQHWQCTPSNKTLD